jgi:hypothetical protein
MVAVHVDETILWRRLDEPGHELVRLTASEQGWTLSGFALFAHEGLPVRLAYVVRCDQSWATVSAHVSGRIGSRQVGLVLASNDAREWTINDTPVPDVSGCVDVDLNFSPSTNVLPIRRLGLEVGESAEVRAAWLRFPSLTVEPLLQTYTRTGESTWRYRSAGGFEAGLEVSPNGLPLTYGDLWAAEARC